MNAVSLLLLSLPLLSVCSGQDTECQNIVGSPCKASCGSVALDISHIMNYPINATGGGDNDYVYNPCSPKGNKCSDNSVEDNALCQILKSRGNGYSIGKVNSATWYLNSTDPYIFTIIYTQGDEGRQSFVTFMQEGGATELKYIAEKPQLHYRFEVLGGNIGQPTGGTSETIAGPIGLVFIFLAVAALCIYFIVGAVFMYYVRGARGEDVIPNVKFWKDLPMLLRDGFLFTISPCYRRGYTEITGK